MKRIHFLYKIGLYSILLSLLASASPCTENLAEIMVELRNGNLLTSTDFYSIPAQNGAPFPLQEKYRKLTSLNFAELVIYQGSEAFRLDRNDLHETISSIELLEANLTPYKDGRMRIIKKNGVVLDDIKGTLFKYIGYPDSIAYLLLQQFDNFYNGWRTAELDIREVKKIIFDPQAYHPSPPKPTPRPLEKSGLESFETTTEGIITRLLSKETDNSYGKVNLSVEFDFDSSRIRPISYSLLDNAGRALKDPKLADKTIQITGHTDSDGPDAYNLKLSHRRAASIRDYLVKKCSIPKAHLLLIGQGEQHPLVPNTTAGNKQINRRAEIRIAEIF